MQEKRSNEEKRVFIPDEAARNAFMEAVVGLHEPPSELS